jgi:hypothetical protein
MAEQIIIDQIAAETIRVPIVGTTPLVVNRFSEKAKRLMLDNMQGRKSPKQPKDPKAEYESALYRFKGGPGFGFPVIAFKDATVGAARFYGSSVKMTELRQFIFFRGEVGADGQQLARIDGEPQMREDVVRVARTVWQVRQVWARHGGSRRGTAGEASHGWAWCGLPRRGRRGLAGPGTARRGTFWQARRGLHGSARLGAAGVAR